MLNCIYLIILFILDINKHKQLKDSPYTFLRTIFFQTMKLYLNNKGRDVTMNKEIDFEFIKYRRQALKVNLKKECAKYGLVYITMVTALAKKLDLKASQLLFLTQILDCNLDDLFRNK